MSEDYTSFDKIFESYYSRYSAGCFAPGDVIKFNASALTKSPEFKALQPDLQARLAAMVDSSEKGDAVIVVNNVAVSALDTYDVAEPSTITIGYSHGGGRIVDLITINGTLGQYMNIVNNGVNLNNTIPANAYRNFDEQNKVAVVALDMNQQEKEYQKGTTGEIDKNTFALKV